MQAEGEQGGPVSLRWTFAPEPQQDGSVTLELKAVARLAASEHDDHDEEARLFEIDVDAY